MESIKDMVDVNTIVGDAVQSQDGSVIIPISKVAFGFAAGGGEFSGNNKGRGSGNNEEESSKFPFAGGSGAGVSIQPMAFMVVNHENIRLLPVTPNNSVDRLIDLIPDLIQRVTEIVKNKLCEGEGEEEEDGHLVSKETVKVYSKKEDE